MCLKPMSAQLNELGKIHFTNEGGLRLPCGKCNECVKKRSMEWALRARHEIACHKENCFLTLTYDNDNLPSPYIVKEEFQKFVKKLRKYSHSKLRYMVSHEYGTKTFRPHHHAIIFGFNPKNQLPLKTTGKGKQIFTSDIIGKLWKHGFHSIGEANEKTAYYIASYSLKGKKHTFPDPNSGEIIEVSDCMDASKRPAIGYEFFQKNKSQLLDSGEILPRYYLKKLKDNDPELFEKYENDRLFDLKTRSSHEIYAKFLIDKQKQLINTTFRETDQLVEKELSYLKADLLTNRNDYHFSTKGKNL